MRFPFTIRFKLAAISSQISVRDADDNELFYVKQKMFKLKEKIEIYRDSSKSQLIGSIKADRVIDFSPLFTMRDASGAELGTIKRQGRKSMWKATYELTLAGVPVATVREANPWTKVLDTLAAQIPFVGIFAGYFFHPEYIVANPEGAELAVLKKRPAFFEGVFLLEDKQLASMPEQTTYYLSVLLMMVTLMERTRG